MLGGIISLSDRRHRLGVPQRQVIADDAVRA
jgi:hypothetical protein